MALDDRSSQREHQNTCGRSCRLRRIMFIGLRFFIVRFTRACLLVSQHGQSDRKSPIQQSKNALGQPPSVKPPSMHTCACFRR